MENCDAILFFGTPHRGSDLAKVLSATLNIVSSNRKFVKDLMVGSSLLKAINDQFIERTERVQVASFWESEAMHGLGVYLQYLCS